jgi:hypothetical protein
MGKNEKYYDSLIDNMQYLITSWKGATYVYLYLDLTPDFVLMFLFIILYNYVDLYLTRL